MRRGSSGIGTPMADTKRMPNMARYWYRTTASIRKSIFIERISKRWFALNEPVFPLEKGLFLSCT
jgi:hypothetical protein